MICDACRKKIKANTAMLVVNTETTAERWHLGCCPYVRELAAGAGGVGRKDRTAA